MNKNQPQDLSKELDQYYTNPVYAQQFLDKIKQTVDLTAVDVLLEPSAGSGAFYNILDPAKRVGLDLDPKCPGVVKQDFFDYFPPICESVITIGNPPFGKNAGLAVKFFNRAAEFSQAIAFVIPRTFRKASIINRLHKNFHLVYDETVPDKSFVYNGEPYDVWCCAQIWVRKEQERPKIPTIKLNQITHWFELVDPSISDFAIQRVGGRAGLIRTNDRMDYSKESHYFIRAKQSGVLDIFQTVNYDSVKYNTAGNPSISPSELVELFVSAAQAKNIDIELLPS